MFPLSDRKNPLRICSCVALLLLALPAGAEPGRTFRADLTGDGRPERIIVRTSAKSDLGQFYEVRVEDSSGTLLWASPKTTNVDSPYAFGAWEIGESLPQMVIDIDGDGALEMLVPAPRSDVSPTYYRIFRWRDGAFHHISNRALFAGILSPDHFTWVEQTPAYGRWIDELLSFDTEGRFTARIGEMQADTYKTGVAMLKQEGTSFHVVRWVTPLAEITPIGDNGEPPQPDEEPLANILPRYRCVIADVDRRNSNGAPLSAIGDILAQDRANVHRFARLQPGDEVDAYFTTAERRAVFQHRRIHIDSRLAHKLRTAGKPVTITVTVYTDHVSVEEGP